MVTFLSFFCDAKAQRRHTPGINYEGNSWDGGKSGYSGSGGAGINSDWAIALNLGYDVPTGKLAESYKATPAFGLHVLYNWKSFTFNASGGYHAYSPKQDSVFYDETNKDLGYYKWSTFKVYELYAGAAYNLKPSEMLNIYAGANIGSYFVSYSFYTEINAEGMTATSDLGISQQNIYIAPKLGFTYQLTGNLGLGLEAKYNIFTPGGNYNSRTGYESYGETYNSYTANVMLSYHF
ncbi:MAG: hypothetical protein EOP46_20815 [Sphingobacteriaceae bacterium]|nr:MAG: hypothetical protein EOP46_20815 [Sphingobacteriaceae bacterium]